MTLRLGRLLLVLTLGLTAGCGSSMKVATDFDRAADFTDLSTYTLIRPEPGERRAVRPASERRIIAAVTRELEAKGYRDVSSDPDFWIGFNVVVADEIDEQTMYTDQKLGYVSSATEVRMHRRGTLVLFITDAAGGQVIWQGTASETFSDPSQETIDKRIDEAVGRMLAEFPPQK
jgi:hypothetical protein